MTSPPTSTPPYGCGWCSSSPRPRLSLADPRYDFRDMFLVFLHGVGVSSQRVVRSERVDIVIAESSLPSGGGGGSGSGYRCRRRRSRWAELEFRYCNCIVVVVRRRRVNFEGVRRVLGKEVAISIALVLISSGRAGVLGRGRRSRSSSWSWGGRHSGWLERS